MIVLTQRLKELRELHSYSQEDVAEILDISPTAYGHYERGRTVPNIEMLKKLAKHYNVSVDYLVGNTSKMNYEDEEKEEDCEIVQILARNAGNLTQKQIDLLKGMIEQFSENNK